LGAIYAVTRLEKRSDDMGDILKGAARVGWLAMPKRDGDTTMPDAGRTLG